MLGKTISHSIVLNRSVRAAWAKRLTTSPNNQTAHSFSPDGKRLVFGDNAAPRDLQVLSMESERTSQPLFQSQFNEGKSKISPDGQRFLMIKEADEEEGQAQINVFLNWFEELKRLVPTN